MAEDTNTCLACGNKADKGSRAPAIQLAYILRRYLSQRCTENDMEINIEQLLSQSQVCRPCARAYQSHEKKDQRLYSATQTYFNSIILRPCVVSPFANATHTSDTTPLSCTTPLTPTTSIVHAIHTSESTSLLCAISLAPTTTTSLASPTSDTTPLSCATPLTPTTITHATPTSESTSGACAISLAPTTTTGLASPTSDTTPLTPTTITHATPTSNATSRPCAISAGVKRRNSASRFPTRKKKDYVTMLPHPLLP